MFKKFQNFLILILFIATIAGFGFGKYTENKYEKELYKLQTALPDTVVQIDSTMVSVLTEELDEVTLKNGELKNVVDRLDGKVRYQNEIIGEYKIKLEDLETAPVIIEEKEARAFSYSDDSFEINGHFLLCEPYSISFGRISALLDLEIVAMETKHGVWKSVVHFSTPRFHVRNAITRAVPYSQTFWEKLGFDVGPYVNIDRLGLMAGFGYEKYKVNFFADTYGVAVGMSYEVF